MTRGDRPENAAPPEVFYNEQEARKYTTNSRMMAIQVGILIVRSSALSAMISVHGAIMQTLKMCPPGATGSADRTCAGAPGFA